MLPAGLRAGRASGLVLIGTQYRYDRLRIVTRPADGLQFDSPAECELQPIAAVRPPRGIFERD
jgi:hypothetical protein